jgi:hypothetical protein
VLRRRVRWFVAATITYNVVEAVVAPVAGGSASSSALLGFGLDSVIEAASAAAVAWQFAGRDPAARERTALRVIAFSFFGLAVFVTVDAVRSLLGVGEAEHSSPGLVLAAVSLAVMPLLSYRQRRTGRKLGPRTAVADSKQTLLCTYLSAVLLVGLALNSALGWSCGPGCRPRHRGGRGPGGTGGLARRQLPQPRRGPSPAGCRAGPLRLRTRLHRHLLPVGGRQLGVAPQLSCCGVRT